MVQVLTDAPAPESAIYLELDAPLPAIGAAIAWGPHHAWWTVGGVEIRVRKVGWAFDWRTEAWAFSAPVEARPYSDDSAKLGEDQNEKPA